jgi:uncharacterized membrane protein HdeD (DUF308 family)
MFLYFGKNFTQNLAGERLARVECDRCGCEYFYQLTRIGTGTATAHYYIGASRAARAAEEGARENLERRLTRETELVPCPKCHWISQPLVDSFRRTRYKFLGKLAIYIVVIGLVVSLFIGGLVVMADPASLPYVLIMPLGILLVAGGVIGLRTWLRSRVRPNRDYPDPPQVPPGTPPALVADSLTGELTIAKTEGSPIAAAGEWCDFQLGRHALPPVCCGCLQPPSPEHAHKQMVAATVLLFIPRCEDCARETNRAYWRIFFTAAVVTTLIAGAAVVPLNVGADEFWIVTLGGLAVAGITAGVIAFRATTPVKVAHGDRSRGVLRLRFRNADYTRLVAEQASGVSEHV